MVQSLCCGRKYSVNIILVLYVILCICIYINRPNYNLDHYYNYGKMMNYLMGDSSSQLENPKPLSSKPNLSETHNKYIHLNIYHPPGMIYIY